MSERSERLDQMVLFERTGPIMARLKADLEANGFNQTDALQFLLAATAWRGSHDRRGREAAVVPVQPGLALPPIDRGKPNGALWLGGRDRGFQGVRGRNALSRLWLHGLAMDMDHVR